MQNKPFPVLGTAMWGWTTPQEICFELLDTFYARGFRQVDTATNYPINKTSGDFRKAEHILREWILAHGISDLEIMVKVGSLNNLGGPEHNLSKSFLLLALDEYGFLFQDNLRTFSIHWDNRDNEADIQETFEALKIAADNGLEIGLSGIKHPEIYARINEPFGFQFSIQFKHNLLYSDFERYEPLHQQGRFFAYGINAGGLKLDPSAYHGQSTLNVRGRPTAYQPSFAPALLRLITKANQNNRRPAIENFNHCGLCFAWYKNGIEGILIGTTKVTQLEHSLDFMEILSNHSYLDVFEDLNTLNQPQ